MAYYSLKQKKLDVLLLCLFPVLASLISLFLKLNFLFSTILFYGTPIVYLISKTKGIFARTLAFSIPFSLVLGTIFDYFATIDHDWVVPTLFPFHIFNIVPIEDIIWGFCFVTLTVVFYEHFFDKGKHKKLDRHMKTLLIGLAVVFLVFVSIFIMNPHSMQIPYFYSYFGIFLIPVAAILYIFPHTYGRLLKAAPYFILIGALNEMTALQLGYWTYTGQHFIGWVQLFSYHLPFEELFYWILSFAIMTMTYFEFFDDTRVHLKENY